MTITEKQGVHFDEATHTYTVGGVVVPSVTQVIKSAGLVDDRWFNEAARDRGRIVAIAIELHSKDNLAYVPDGYQGYVDAWEKFRDETGFVPHVVEQPVYHVSYGYAGTPDAVGKMAERDAIIDVKTGCDSPHYSLQTAGYGGMFRVGSRGYDRYCVFLNDNGKYKIRQHTDPRDWDVFLAALKIVHWKREKLK
jgi:hypothetical protein